MTASIRRSFTQVRSRGGGAGPLAAFVTGRRRRALDLYLLAHAICSAPPWDVTLGSVVWARLLGLTGGIASVITRQWNWLEDQELIVTSRHDRLRKVTLLKEGVGSGKAYTSPA